MMARLFRFILTKEVSFDDATIMEKILLMIE
jgi:hypothetical protein